VNIYNLRRIWEIDLLRGIAIIMMIAFHVLYYINYFDIYFVDLGNFLFLIFNYSIGTIFLLLVGISLTISYSMATTKLTDRGLRFKYLKRGLKIFLYGLFITVVTWYFLVEGFVIFGVLHCIGLSIIISYPFLRYRYSNLFLGVIFVIIGFLLYDFAFDFYWLVWLGFKPFRFYTIDYFPILPWFGVILIGIFLGNSLYVKKKRTYKIKDLTGNVIVRVLMFLGRHSLIIYFLHHIILLSVIYPFFIL
jgi:uncharacterized membrane protein